MCPIDSPNQEDYIGIRRVPEHSVALILGGGCPGHTGSKRADPSLHQMCICLLTLAAASPWEECSCYPRNRAQPTHVRLSTSPALGSGLGGERDLAAELVRSRQSKFLSQSSLEQRGGHGELWQLCATGVCLFDLPVE